MNNAYISNFTGQSISQMIQEGKTHLHLTASLIESPSDVFGASLGYTQRARYSDVDMGGNVSDHELWEAFYDDVSTDITRWIEDRHELTVETVFGHDPTGFEDEADIVVTFEKA